MLERNIMDENLSKYAYKLVLNADQQINWKIKLSNGQTRIYPREPKIKWWQKAGVIPDYAKMPDGTLTGTTLFYKTL